MKYEAAGCAAAVVRCWNSALSLVGWIRGAAVPAAGCWSAEFGGLRLGLENMIDADLDRI
jgi:hypothetical protein